MLSSTAGDLLADEIVTENPNPPHAAPADVEVIEETKYDTHKYIAVAVLRYVMNFYSMSYMHSM